MEKFDEEKIQLFRRLISMTKEQKYGKQEKSEQKRNREKKKITGITEK